jgi:hypothetical protein
MKMLPRAINGALLSSELSTATLTNDADEVHEEVDAFSCSRCAEVAPEDSNSTGPESSALTRSHRTYLPSDQCINKISPTPLHCP